MSDKQSVENSKIIKDVSEKRKKNAIVKKKRLLHVLIIGAFFSLIIIFTTIFLVLNSISDKEELREKGIDSYKSGEFDSAIKCFNESINEKQFFSDKMDADTEMYLAACYVRTGQYQPAIDIYNRYISQTFQKTSMTSADLEDACNVAKALSFVESGNADTLTINSLKSEYDKGNRSVGIYLGTCYQLNEDYDNMVSYYTGYANDFGMNTYIAYQLSSYYLDKNDLDSAITVINQGLSAGDDLYKDKVLFNSVVLSEKKLEYENALDKATELINEYPNNEIYQNEYNFLYTRVNIDTVPVHTED
ncbi:MAG: tetratricopeptide repeat protein [Eubacterium sp.]|nr:tetratricopeptide repeat protein [Eubacterium sp.]